MVEMLALAAFGGLLLYAAVSDVRSLTIPNWVSLALSGAFLLAAPAAGLPLGTIGAHAVLSFCVLAVGFFLFQANILGGGDAKLLAATTLWAGPSAIAPFLFWTATAGGLMALGLLAARHFVPQTATNPAFVNRLLTAQSGIPYGLAIMIGGLLAIPSLALAPHPLTLP